MYPPALWLGEHCRLDVEGLDVEVLFSSKAGKIVVCGGIRRPNRAIHHSIDLFTSNRMTLNLSGGSPLFKSVNLEIVSRKNS